jgi:F0F1-type ATP synthase membrane subunit b/b'
VTEHGAGHHHPTVVDLFEPAVNFALFAALLVYLLRGPLREFFRDRAARIREALDAGTTARDEARALRVQIEKDMADLPRRREQLKAELFETAELQKARLLESARETAARIRTDAETLAVQEEAGARRALREELARGAVDEATRLVAGAIGADDQKRFIRDFVDVARTL